MASSPHSQSLGFTRDLFILPFDHRGSFQEKLFGIKGRSPNREETLEIASYKRIIFDGFKKSIRAGVPKEKAGILVDEQFGHEILTEAKSDGYIIACPTEKSGQDEFDFEYGNEYSAHIDNFQPTFVKVLVRYNPQGDSQLNQRQAKRLKQLSDYCGKAKRKFMFELLVPATQNQLEKFQNDSHKYDRELRPQLMVETMRELQDFGIEPDVWKLEGIESSELSLKVSEQARCGNRSNVGVIVLGRGENAEKVKLWLETAAKVPGLIGFAVGRTVFWESLKGVREKKWSANDASEMISKNYKGFCDLWTTAKTAAEISLKI